MIFCTRRSTEGQDVTTLVTDGITSIDVKNDALIINHGFPRGQFTAVLERQDTAVDHIVFASRHGVVTFAAMQWMAAVGITWSVLADGYRNGDDDHYSVYPIGTSAPRPRQALLRRAQAAAQGRRVGIDITRLLLGEKFLGQRDIAEQLGSDVALEIESSRQQLTTATLDQCRQIEAHVAKKLYWDVWKSVRIDFADKVPDFWCVFPSRTSSISGNSPRNAACPINALLNYAYGVLENGTVAACHSMGLDPLLGILHSDQNNRYSLAADLMEPGRPMVDALILELMESHKFRKNEFIVTSSGKFKLKPELTKSLAVMVMEYLPQLHTVWEAVLNMLIEDEAKGEKRRKTPLTRNNSKKRYVNGTND